uniref:Sorting nexin-27 n=1 Tax=Bursaphelenchus xylophilus TaxID=6326 RepID=A0A1I7S1S2_BURXY
MSFSGFGFNVKGQVSEGGQLRSINGELYAPLQHVSAVLEGGAAEKAGLLRGDRILEVNGANVEGATHRQVVELIRQGGDRLQLVVISVTSDMLEEESYEDESQPSLKYDYTEKRSLPITIPTYQRVQTIGEAFIAFNLHMAGRHLGSRRYSEFVTLDRLLKEEFPDFQFPKLPSKWPFHMTEQRLDGRRRGLETYLEKVCTIKVIADCDIMQEFLMEDSPPVHSNLNVALRVLLPNQSAIQLSVNRNADTITVFDMVMKELNFSPDAKRYCALFEMIDTTFERKLKARECPHNIYIQNYSSAASSCILLKKWCFDIDVEREICRKDAGFRRLCFHQAVNDVNMGHVEVKKDKLYQLKALQSEETADQYLEALREMEGYSEASFPPADFHANNRVGIVYLRFDFDKMNIALKFAESKKEKQLDLEWSYLQDYQLSSDNASVMLRIQRDNVVEPLFINTEYAEYVCDVIDRVMFEREKRNHDAPELKAIDNIENAETTKA